MIDIEEFEERHPELVNALKEIDFFNENPIDEDDTYYIVKYLREGNYNHAMMFIEDIKDKVYILHRATERAYDYIEELTKGKKNG